MGGNFVILPVMNQAGVLRFVESGVDDTCVGVGCCPLPRVTHVGLFVFCLLDMRIICLFPSRYQHSSTVCSRPYRRGIEQRTSHYCHVTFIGTWNSIVSPKRGLRWCPARASDMFFQGETTSGIQSCNIGRKISGHDRKGIIILSLLA